MGPKLQLNHEREDHVWITWRVSPEELEATHLAELGTQSGTAPGLHENISFHVTATLAAGRWRPRLQEPAAWLRGTMDKQRLTLAFEGNGHTQAELVPERCAFPTLDPGDCPDASLQLVVLWIVQPQDIRPAEAGRFVFGQALGKGQSSQVLEVRDTITGRRDLVAKLSDKYELLQEAMVLKALQGLETFPDFIGLFAGDQPETQRFLVLQRFHGSLEDLRKDADPIDVIPTVGIQVLAQLRAMHQLNLAHGDLKTKNMAVVSVKPLRISLIDFGCCRPFRVSSYWVYPRSKAAVGTTRFCAIPAHHGERSPRCDLESLAYVLIYLASGHLPWQGLVAQSTREHSLQMLGKKQDFGALERHIRSSVPALADALTEMAWICRNLCMEEEPPYTELQNLLEAGLPS